MLYSKLEITGIFYIGHGNFLIAASAVRCNVVIAASAVRCNVVIAASAARCSGTLAFVYLQVIVLVPRGVECCSACVCGVAGA